MLHTALDTIQLATGTPPPGSDKFTLIGEWAKWVAGAALVIAVVIAGVMMGFGGHGRGGGEHGMKLVWALVGTVVVGAAASFVTLLS